MPITINLTRSVKTNPRKNKDTGLYDTSSLLPVQHRGVVMTDDYLNNTKPLFEWLKSTDIVKPYFDVDCYCEGEEEYNSYVADNTVLNDTLDALHTLYPDIKNEDLRISSYNGLTNDDKYKVSYHVILNGYRAVLGDLHTVAKQLNDEYDGFDTAVYRTAGLMRVGGHHKEPPKPNTRKPCLMYWDEGDQCFKDVHNATKNPQGINNTDFRYQHLIKYTDPDAPMLIEHTEPPTPPTPPTTPESPTEVEAVPEPEVNFSVDTQLLEKLKALPDTYLNDRNQWWYISMLLKAMGEKATWDAWSKESHKYTKSGNSKIWNGIKVDITNTEAKARLHKKIQKETDLIWRVHEACVDGSTEAMCEFFIREYKNAWRVVEYPKQIYMFDADDTLWKKVSESRLNTYITEFFGPIRTAYKKQLNEDPKKFFGDSYDPDDKECKKMLKQTIKNADFSKYTTTKNTFRVEYFNRKEIQDPQFRQKLNRNPDVISTLDGIVSLETGVFRERKYDDYFSKCLTIPYDASKTNPDFEQFMYDIFDHPELNTAMIRDSMQEFLGYSCTGHNSDHQAVILHGCGGNGKSVLNDILFKTFDCKYGQMINSWSSKFMDDNRKDNESTNQATPELAKLVDCNIGIINETKKSMTFGEQFKKWNDTCEKFGYRMLNQNPDHSRLITSFLISTNHFPQFPVDRCFTRRIRPIPMWVKFKVDPDPDVPWEKEQDTGLFTRMTGTTDQMQGILNWMIKGAMKWYANGRKLSPLPPCVEAQKQRYIDSNDWTKLFQIGGDVPKTEGMWLDDIVNLIRVNNPNNECPYNKTELIEELKAKGSGKIRRIFNSQTKKKDHYVDSIKECTDSDDDDDEEEQAEQQPMFLY